MGAILARTTAINERRGVLKVLTSIQISDVRVSVHYGYYVRRSPDNRAEFKRRMTDWYRENHASLVWRPIPEIAIGGVFALPDEKGERTDG